jgi:hypothetical protein
MTHMRISQSATIVLHGHPADVFPLFGAVEEKKWAEGWNPEILYSGSGEMEQHMIFRTKPLFRDERDYLWIVSVYDPPSMHVEYTVSTDQRIWTITVVCRTFPGNFTEATVTYTYTGFTDDGIRHNAESMALIFAHDLRDWEEAINHYLSKGLP